MRHHYWLLSAKIRKELLGSSFRAPQHKFNYIQCCGLHDATGASDAPPSVQSQHLARQLSKYRITPEEQAAWENQVKSFPPVWIKRPITCAETGVMIHIFPTYELVGLQKTHEASLETNVVFEVRDVRVPASSHHPSYTRIAKHRKHLICYTHADLIDSITKDRVKKWTQRSWPGSECIFVDSRETRKDENCFSELRQWLIDAVIEKGGNNFALTIGVPNTGKSSVLLAALRGQTKIKQKVGSNLKSGKPQIENMPGKTRDFEKYLLQQTPRVYCLDVPGISPPTVLFLERPEAWYALCAANLLKIDKCFQSVETDTKIAEYVLFTLNRDRNFAYVKKLGLDGPTCDIDGAVQRLKQKGTTFLKLFNTGNFGSVVLDDISSKYAVFQFTDINTAEARALHRKRSEKQ